MFDFNTISVFPNPFSNQINFDFNLVHASTVQFLIRNEEGKQVALLADGNLNPGYHHLSWTPENLPAGIFFYELKSRLLSQNGKILLIK